jgi:hypothetical protein
MPAAPTTLRADPAAADKAVAPSKSKAAAAVPIKAPPADIAFPGGSVSPVCDGRMTVTGSPDDLFKIVR